MSLPLIFSEIMCVRYDARKRYNKNSMFFLCEVALLLELVEGSTFLRIGLKSFRCLPCCRLVYVGLSRAEFGGRIVDDRLWEK